MSYVSLLFVVAAACGFPRPPNVGDDVPIDSSVPSLTVRVSPAGNDGNDGLVQPVKSLKRAIAIASANTTVTTIALAAGRYAAGADETFPYAVPRNLTIEGPVDDDAILVGSMTDTGLTIDSGVVQRLVFENFAVAISVTGVSRLSNLRIRLCKLAVTGQGLAMLIVDNMDITGIIGSSPSECSSGIMLKDSSILMATMLAARNLLSAVNVKDDGSVSVNKANVTQDRCGGTAFVTNTSKQFTLSDSYVVGGLGTINMTNVAPSVAQVVVTNTMMLNHIGSAVSGLSVMFRMTGGEISGNGTGALETTGGNWSFTNVVIRNNNPIGIYLQGMDQGGIPKPSFLTMRGCTITGNSGGGIALLDGAIVDLGTDTDPGNNTIQGNSGVGLAVNGIDGPRQVNAVGNTWNVNRQGSNGDGRYLNVATIPGPFSGTMGDNYVIDSGLSLRR